MLFIINRSLAIVPVLFNNKEVLNMIQRSDIFDGVENRKKLLATFCERRSVGGEGQGGRGSMCTTKYKKDPHEIPH